VRASRLLAILNTLQVRGRATAPALAAQLEVSTRTVMRDIDELVAAGIPVYAERGREGGFRLTAGFRTELTGLTAEESEALLLAGVPAAAADLGFAGAASAARVKLLSALEPAARSEAARVAERFHVDPSDWYQRPRPPRHLRTVAQATWHARRIEVRYESWRATSLQTLEPLGVVVKAGRWYVMARSGATPARIYRLEAIVEARDTGHSFVRPPRFDLAREWRAAVAGFEAGLRRGRAVLRASPASLSRLDRLGADIAEPLRDAVPDPSGWREAEVPIESVGHAASLLLGFADDLIVVSPAELRAELARRARRVVACYRRRRGPAPDAER
jgi:predicted DNA-binding transcriptional regulator YafY